MVSADRLQKRLETLQQERAALATVIADLEAGRGKKHKLLQELWAAAERTPTDESTRAADHAEREYDTLGRQVERKQAALDACAVDLGKAQADVDKAERADVVAELQGLYDQIEKAAQRVDANLTDAAAWGELTRMTQQVNAIYWTRLGSKGHGTFQTIFAHTPARLRDRVFAYHARRCEVAMNDKASMDVPVARMVDLLDLEQAQGRIRSLKP